MECFLQADASNPLGLRQLLYHAVGGAFDQLPEEMSALRKRVIKVATERRRERGEDGKGLRVGGWGWCLCACVCVCVCVCLCVAGWGSSVETHSVSASFLCLAPTTAELLPTSGCWGVANTSC